MRGHVAAMLLVVSTAIGAEPLSVRIVSPVSISIEKPPPCSGTMLLHPRCLTSPCGDPVRKVPFHAIEGSIAIPDDAWSGIEFESAECWIAPIAVPPDTARQLQTTVWPAARVGGRVELSDGGPMAPLSAHLKIGSDTAEVMQDCTVAASRWRCAIPAAPLSMRLEIAGYAPRHVWDVDVAAGDELDIGTVQFRRGATITGFLMKPRALSSGITVELLEEKFTQSRPVATAEPNKDNFEFTGVTPGVYRVVARAQGFSPARSEPISVTSSPLYNATGLRLEELATLKVLVHPPTDARQRPWRVTLDRTAPLSPYTTPVAKATLEPSGWWERSGLEAGVYMVAIADDEGAVQHNERVLVQAGMPVVEIQLSQIPIRGTLTIGAKAVAAEIRFTSVGVASGKNVVVHSDDDGEFAGWLPHEGTWNARVKMDLPRAYVMKRGVEIKRRGDASHAEVDLVLPGGTVKGETVDDAGNAVIAEVMLFREGRVEAVGVSDESGRFEFFGVDEGEVSVQATSVEGESGLIAHTVSEAMDSSLRLVLGRAKRVRGTVVTSEGLPLAGAALRYAASTMPGYAQAVVGPGGRFDLRVPHQTQSLTVAILAVGRPVSVQTITISDREQQLVVGAAAGQLLIPMTPKSEHPLIAPPGGLVLSVGALVFPPDGSGLPRGLNDQGFAIDLSPGHYTFCTALNECRSIAIHPGQQTVVQPRAK